MVFMFMCLSTQVWYYDGTVRCFVDPGHAVLAIWAIIVLLLIVAAMAAILFVLLQSERLKVSPRCELLHSSYIP